MKNSVKTLVGLGVVAIAVGIFAVANSSVGVQAQEGCSLTTLTGTYIYAYDGYEAIDGQNVPFALAGRESYDGAGAFSGVFSGIDSTGINSYTAYEGTYTVNNDCTGRITSDPGTDLELNYDIFIDESTGNFNFVGVDEGIVTQGLSRKIQN